MPGGRPPKPLEQRRRTGRAPGRDSGGRKLPDLASVTALPGVVDEATGQVTVPTVPTSLRSADRASVCPYRDRAAPEGQMPCPVCVEAPGREAWDRLWTAGRTWLSPSTDLDILTDLCRAYGEMAHHQHVLEQDGPYVRGQRGGLVAHPAIAMLRQVESRVDRLRAQCGFTPVDRGRMGVGEVKRGESDLGALLRRRAGGQ